MNTLLQSINSLIDRIIFTLFFGLIIYFLIKRYLNVNSQPKSTINSKTSNFHSSSESILKHPSYEDIFPSTEILSKPRPLRLGVEPWEKGTGDETGAFAEFKKALRKRELARDVLISTGRYQPMNTEPTIDKKKMTNTEVLYWKLKGVTSAKKKIDRRRMLWETSVEDRRREGLINDTTKNERQQSNREIREDKYYSKYSKDKNTLNKKFLSNEKVNYFLERNKDSTSNANFGNDKSNPLSFEEIKNKEARFESESFNIKEKKPEFDANIQLWPLSDFIIQGDQLKPNINSMSPIKSYLGTHKPSNSSVVIQVLRKQGKNIHDLVRLVNNIGKLRHPNLVVFYGILKTENPDQIPLIFENCGVTTLAQIKRINSPMNEATVKKIANQLLKALEYLASQELMHRHIEPNKIFVDQEYRIKLGGLRHITQSPSNGYVSVYDTSYQSPELKQGDLHNTSTDIYSIGVIVYELLTGHLPTFDEDGLSSLYVEKGISEIARNFLKEALDEYASLRPGADKLLKAPWFDIVFGF